MAAKNRFNHIDCLAAALPDEEYFVLLARDPAFPALLGIWASLRVGNFKAAAENFQALMEPGLVRHYQAHPDMAKSQEVVETANRGADWRAANLNGPNGRPTWKDSLVRPAMFQPVDLYEKAAATLIADSKESDLRRKIATGLRQVASDIGGRRATMSIAGDRLHADISTYMGRINGYAAELEAGPARFTGKHPALGAPYGSSGKPKLDDCPGRERPLVGDEIDGDMS